MKISRPIGKLLKIVVCGVLLFSVATLAQAEVPVSIFGSSHWAAASIDHGRIRQLVKSAFQFDKNESNFHRAMVKVICADNGDPDHLVVHILSKKDYHYDTYRVNLKRGYGLGAIIKNYVVTVSDMAQDVENDTYAACPDNSVDMVFATNLSSRDYPTAAAAVDYAANLAQSAGYNVKVLKGSAENVAAYANWLRCANLKMIGRVGHGSTTGIAVSDGTVSYSLFNGLGSNALTNKVIYFNSCQTHNSPLEPAIVGAGAQRFVGGNVNLYVGPSEEVFKCWLDKVVNQGEAMTTSLTTCERAKYPRTGAHGISGNGSDYFTADGSSSGSSSSSTSSTSSSGGTTSSSSSGGCDGGTSSSGGPGGCN